MPNDKTRSKKPAASKKDDVQTKSITTTPTLEPSVANPPQISILPKHTSRESRIVTLPNPATTLPLRYLICPEKGCYEFTRVAPAHRKACKSCLLAPSRTTNGGSAEAEGKVDGENGESDEGYVLSSPDLMIATPIDPLFLILPALLQEEKGVQMYLSPSDYTARLEESSEHFRHMIHGPGGSRLERMLEERLLSVCDSMDAGDETLYRWSRAKLLEVLIEKARNMARSGLPASMEERFVKQALVVPVLSIRREESSLSMAEEVPEARGDTDEKDPVFSVDASQDTQGSSAAATATSVSTAATSISSTPTTREEVPMIPIKEEGEREEVTKILHLLRIRTALNFILASYIPPTLRAELSKTISSTTTTVSIDFTPLTMHLTHLDALRKEAQALRSLSDNISRKRSAEDDEEAVVKAEAKKRKKDEEGMRKKNTSRGVQQLMKADRSGMKSLSSFFGAKTVGKGKG